MTTVRSPVETRGKSKSSGSEAKRAIPKKPMEKSKQTHGVAFTIPAHEGE